MARLGQNRRRQRITVGIGIILEHTTRRDHQGRILRRAVVVVLGDRVVVDGGDEDRHCSYVRLDVVDHGQVGEPVGAREVADRHIVEGAVTAEGELTMPRERHGHRRHRARLDGHVIIEHPVGIARRRALDGHVQRRVFCRVVAVVGSDGPVEQRQYVDPHRRRSGLGVVFAAAIVDGVSEGHQTEEVRRRLVDEPTIGLEGQRTDDLIGLVLRIRRIDRLEAVTVDVVVVGDDTWTVQHQAAVLDHVVRVVERHRLVVHRLDDDRHRREVRLQAPWVFRQVDERVDAVKVRVRRVGKAAIRCQCEGAPHHVADQHG